MQLELSEEVRRYIGDRLLGVEWKTASISGLSRSTDISRPTLVKWIGDAYRLYWLTKHIGDATLDNLCDRNLITGDSHFFDHAVGYSKTVRRIRENAAAGKYGDEWQREEFARRRTRRGAK